MKIKDLLNEDTSKNLSDESLTMIQEAFDAKVQSAVEDALEAQDELYSENLKTLVATIDKDHSNKMRRVVEAVDKNNTQKLLQVTKKFKRDGITEAKKFKVQIVNSVSDYLDEYLNEAIPAADIKQAVKNKSAYGVLENLRSVLSVNSAVMKESIRGAVIDGQQKLVESNNKFSELNKEFEKLKADHVNLQRDMILESKTQSFNSDKKNFIKKTFKDKPIEFINENIDYAIKLFDKKEKSKLGMIKEEAITKRQHKPDFVKTEKVVTEKVNTNKAQEDEDPYVAEMNRKFGNR